ncbi:MAG: hypothetical protein ABIL40_07805 [candidate division WOR-3 bacterium]
MNNIIENKAYLFHTLAGGFCFKLGKTMSLYLDGGVGLPMSPMESSTGPVKLFYIFSIGLQSNRPFCCGLGCWVGFISKLLV